MWGYNKKNLVEELHDFLGKNLCRNYDDCDVIKTFLIIFHDTSYTSHRDIFTNYKFIFTNYKFF